MSIEQKNITRRDFLKGTAKGAIGIAAAGLLSGCSTPGAAPVEAPVEQTPPSVTPAPAAQEQTGQVQQLWDTPPAPITSFSEIIDTEILIAGAGNGGIFAACAAAEAGAKVLVIERNAVIGIGREWIGAIGSKKQLESGKNPNKFEVVEELCKYASHRADQRLINLWADKSGETVDWLDEVIQKYGGYVHLETDTGEDDHGFYKTFCIQHNIQNDEEHLLTVTLLTEYAKEMGIEFLMETPLAQLIQEPDGRVSGAVAGKEGAYIRINASKGVILATGGYSANLDMLQQINPLAINSCTCSDTHVGSQGDGLKAATWIGAAKDEVPTVMIFDRGGCPPDAVTGGDLKQGIMTHIGSQPFLKVNKHGERFVNESIPYDFMIHAGTLGANKTYCMIWDANWVEHTRKFHTLGCSRIQYSPSGSKLMLFDEMATEGFHQGVLMPAGIVVEDDTLEGLANKLNIPADTLVETVERYNELCANGKDEDFGKESYRMIAIDTPPYRAATIGGQLLCTLDGLRINTNMQVLDKQMNPIPGLFAVGNDSGGFFANNYPELVIGVACGRTVTFGRLAGQYVASL